MFILSSDIVLTGLTPRSLIFFIHETNSNASSTSPLDILDGVLVSLNTSGKYDHPNASTIVLIVNRILPTGNINSSLSFFVLGSSY